MSCFPRQSEIEKMAASIIGADMLVDDSPLTAVVMDNGSGCIKAGFGGEDAPRMEMTNIVGRSRHPGVSGIMLGLNTDNMVGDEAQANSGIIDLSRPVERGIVKDWDDMQHVWQRAFVAGLQVPIEEHPLLITESPDNTRLDRERMAQILFECFGLSYLVISNSLTLSLFSTGRSSGVVVDSGYGRTHIGPVWEGYAMPHYLRRLDVGGRDTTDHLISKLRSSGYPFSTENDWDIANRIKEELCYVAGSAEKELDYCKQSKSIERLYTLPDGQQVYMNENRFMAPEVMFNPSLMGYRTLNKSGIHSTVHETVQCCDEAIQNELYGAVVLAGGNTLFPKMDERLQREIAQIAPTGRQSRVIAFANRKYATWIGGSIVGSLSTFPAMWISKTEYDDFGASIVHRKC